MPCSASGESLEGLRAVAKTWWPARWKAMARAAPIPPGEQPVIRIVRLLGGGIALFEWEERWPFLIFGGCRRSIDSVGVSNRFDGIIGVGNVWTVSRKTNDWALYIDLCNLQ